VFENKFVPATAEVLALGQLFIASSNLFRKKYFMHRSLNISKLWLELAVRDVPSYT